MRLRTFSAIRMASWRESVWRTHERRILEIVLVADDPETAFASVYVTDAVEKHYIWWRHKRASFSPQKKTTINSACYRCL